MEFKDRFKQLRIETGLTQKDFIENFNKKYHHSFGTPSISMYENGHRIPEIDALMDFADYFNVSVDYLLGRTDKKYNTPEDFPENFTEKDKEDVITRIQEIYNDLENQEMLMLSASQPVDAITKEMLKSALASAVTIAKAQQKEDEKTGKRPEILNALEELKEIKNKE